MCSGSSSGLSRSGSEKTEHTTEREWYSEEKGIIQQVINIPHVEYLSEKRTPLELWGEKK
jgi:hypothetical protein